MALIAQPFRHPDSGIYYLRRRVPNDLRQALGKSEIRRSLQTRDYRLAKAAFASAYAESEKLFQDARHELNSEGFQHYSTTSISSCKATVAHANTQPRAIARQLQRAR